LDFAGSEILESLEALLAQLHANHVEDLARRYRQFAPNHLVFRLGVAADFDFFDLGWLALLHLIDQVHRASFGIGVLDRLDPNPVPVAFADITVRAVKVLDRFNVPFQALGRENLRFEHPRFDRSAQHDRALADLVRRELDVAFELDRADFVALAFVNDEPDDHPPGGEIVELDLLDFKIDVTLVPITILQLLLVFLELLLLEFAAA